MKIIQKKGNIFYSKLLREWEFIIQRGSFKCLHIVRREKLYYKKIYAFIKNIKHIPVAYLLVCSQ